MKDPTFRGVYPALTTPFRPDLSLDVEGFARLTDAVIGDGVHGIVVNGCTGESWSLSADERRTRVPRRRSRPRAGRVRVVAGCSGQSAAETLAKIRQAADAGCDCAMVSPPWYIMPGPEEILEHYRKILAASPLPVLLYNIPRRTGVSLDRRHRRPPRRRSEGHRHQGELEGLGPPVRRSSGARATASACSRAMRASSASRRCAKARSATSIPARRSSAPSRSRSTGPPPSGDLETARALQADMERMLAAYFGLGTFPASIKAALDLLGRPGGPTRDPIRPLDAGAARNAAQADGRVRPHRRRRARARCLNDSPWKTMTHRHCRSAPVATRCRRLLRRAEVARPRRSRRATAQPTPALDRAFRRAAQVFPGGYTRDAIMRGPHPTFVTRAQRHVR